MISINNLSYFIGGRALYENASLHIKPKDKIGLIGLNGTGKSTLLRIIDGEYKIDGGEISKSNDCTIGFLNQDQLSFQSEDSILSVAMQAFDEALKVQKKIDDILKKLETEYSDGLVEKLTSLQEKFDQMDGYTIQARTEEVLEGIGFTTDDLSRPLAEFSGGWRMRVILAKLLLQKPSLLMLDEPTNHLDLPSIEWIEQYLRNYDGAVIVVSHDRQFLNNTVSRIVEVAQAQLNPYEGNYDFYLEEKEMRQEIQQNAFENQQQKIKQTERFIERFRAKATKARQVQSRVKALERMDRVDEVLNDSAVVNFNFRFSKKSGRHVMRLEDVSKSYGELTILEETKAHIERGDKIALIGANGKGKSTLLRIIAGSEPIQGKRHEGHNVIKGFYAQHQLEALTIKNDILEELKQLGTDKSELELRQLLGCFLFTDDDVFKKIKVLSGGEKSRVALAKTLIGEANFLLLDEPTNHLDFQSENILIQALQQYEGTYVVVSHNRHFVSKVANKIWYIEDQEIKEYPGSYDEYLYWRDNQKISTPKTDPKPTQPNKTKQPAEKPRHQSNEVDKLKKEISKLEKEITDLESTLTTAEEELSKPEVFSNPDELQIKNEAYQKIKTQLDEKNELWESKMVEIESLESDS